ncbi:hypothetical protein [Dapis sp. BLCC M172]|uniref:hypothetical protein n=1 Tax=Dapis sp. BLCC M172 TaxID=2975281 RepID=UPI003CEB7062
MKGILGIRRNAPFYLCYLSSFPDQNLVNSIILVMGTRHLQKRGNTEQEEIIDNF